MGEERGARLKAPSWSRRTGSQELKLGGKSFHLIKNSADPSISLLRSASTDSTSYSCNGTGPLRPAISIGCAKEFDVRDP